MTFIEIYHLKMHKETQSILLISTRQDNNLPPVDTMSLLDPMLANIHRGNQFHFEY